MFQTIDSAKLPLQWKGTGESLWSYAELMVNALWFYADCKFMDGLDTISSTFLLSRSSQISDLLNQPKITIRSIYLVSPPYINRTASWSMNPLVKLSVGRLKNEESESNIEIYELADGSKYYSSYGVQSDEGITNIKVLYS
ncbi:hypothetical protein C3Y98_08765 [Methylotenera oryzisoli]|uniref:Uncharacterized protein n=1 Tax=Methylotenera oryzisoli TaxID=2080758 RepID=A0A4Y9VRD7_9PROT|nr:hypothetical protein [Methylotenera oryzisoli]TFW70757.1 hypothetical protein C3Y98_08765 [Methylotenera oryzisoli]